ncbi:MAG TPA: preprotein translocase subunit YajC [Acidimicrobiia bacterium]|nr:preprotein translocase subunit YajC [Acidimicrobiia bacterium]
MLPIVFAQDATGTGTGSLIFLVLMVAVFYFLIIRPQRNRQKKQAELAESLQIGDEVQTIGGIKGRVRRLDGDDIVLEIEQGEIRMSRRSVANRLGPERPETPE